MPRRRLGHRIAPFAALLLAWVAAPRTAQAHGFVGDRFFPPTMQIDDPFAVDELALPSVTMLFDQREADVGFGASKEIFPRFALSVADTYVVRAPAAQPLVAGFDDLEANAKFQVWQDAAHEAVFSFGADWTIGGTGASGVGASPTDVFTPTIYAGKGFGDLPRPLRYLRPFALTAVVGQSLPEGPTPHALAWGFALEYDLRYLQTEVKNVGLPAPFASMMLVTEVVMSTPEDHGGGPTTGTIAPGVFYESNDFQLGAEALLPVGDAGGVGATLQLQLYLDDLWPKVFGHPLIGR